MKTDTSPPQGGFSIFYPDDGLDTGDLLLTRCCRHLYHDLHHHHQLHHHHLHNQLTIFFINSLTTVIASIFNRECNVSVNDTVDSLYNNFMYPEGVKAMGEAVQVGQDHDVCKTLTPLR